MATDSGQQSPINLPPGFQLDNPQTQPQQQQSAPPSQSSLPPGFVLDQPQSQGVKPDGGVLGQAALGALAGSVPNEPTLAQLQKYAQQIGVPVERAPELAGAYKDAVAKQQEAQNQPAEYTKQNIAENIGEGALKGTGQTVSGLAGIAEKIPGVGDIPLVKHLAEESKTGDYQTHGIAQATGNIAENILEFFGGDEALKALGVADRFAHAAKFAKFLEDSPRAAKAFEIGMNALRQGTVASGQTLAKGGTGKEANETGAVVGVASGAFGAAGEGAGALYRILSARTPEAIEAAQVQAAKEGTELAEKIAATPLKSGVEAAQDVKYQLGKAEDNMHANFAQGMHNISQQVPDLVINTAGSPLQQAARDILGDTTLPPEMQKALKGVVPDMAKLEPLLKTLADGDETQGFTYSWEQMLNMRSAIGKTIRRLPYDSPIRGDLINLRGAMDNTIQQSVDKAGVPDVAKDLQNLRNAYATKIKAFDASAIKNLAEKNPDSIVPILMRGEKIFNADTLRSLIGEQNMKPVQGQLLREMIDNAYSTVTKSGGTEQQFNPRVFVKNFENLSPEVQKAFWGDNLPEVQNFLKTVESVPNLDSKLAAAQHYLTHRALFDAPLAASALLVGSPESWRGGEIRGLGLIVGGLLLFNRPQLLNLVSKFLTKGVPDIVGGTAQEINKPEENKTENPPNENNESENMLTKPENHVHIRNSEGNEFFIPQNQMDKARQIDPGLQLLKESGQENA